MPRRALALASAADQVEQIERQREPGWKRARAGHAGAGEHVAAATIVVGLKRRIVQGPGEGDELRAGMLVFTQQCVEVLNVEFLSEAELCSLTTRAVPWLSAHPTPLAPRDAPNYAVVFA